MCNMHYTACNMYVIYSINVFKYNNLLTQVYIMSSYPGLNRALGCVSKNSPLAFVHLNVPVIQD